MTQIKNAQELKTVFVVDDYDVNLLLARDALSEQYNVYTLPSALDMFEFLEKITPDLILLDIEMPKMDGFEALKLLKSSKKHADIPVIFLTGRDDDISEAHGLEIGAVDFISKPFSSAVLLNHIRTHLNIESLIRERTEKLQKLKTSIINVLAHLMESRDQLTGGHIERTTKYLRILLIMMLKNGIYIDEINEWDLEEVISSARLHDVGKISISDVLLNSREKLTPDEFEIMKTHAAEGEKIIDSIIAESGEDNFLYHARLFAGCHHERWDGTGYPRGLKGMNIPLQGRIMAIVDVYDALVSERPYKNAFSHKKAVSIITESKDTHFDPKIADVFIEVSSTFSEVGLWL